MATPNEVMKIVGFMAAAYPNFKLQKATVDAYAELLSDLDPEILATAAKQAISESEFFPTIARIREKVLSLTAIASADPDHTQAWNELMGEVTRVGYEQWNQTHFSTALIREMAHTYWREACYTDLDNMPTLRAQFRDSYNARLNRQLQEARLLPSSNQMIHELADKLSMKRIRGGNGHI